MGEMRDAGGTSAQSPRPWTLEELAQAAAVLRPVPSYEKKDILRDQAARVVDRLLARVARGRGAMEVAMGEGLAALAQGNRTLQLGYASLGDYARERLGMAERTAQEKARLARELRDRPLLREAVRRGEVSARKAQAVLPVARGEDEERWVARARTESVRALEIAARGALAEAGREAPQAEGQDEAWERICIPLSAEERAKLDHALALAGKLLGPTAPVWQRLEAICEEYLSAHPAEEPCEEIEGILHWPVGQLPEPSRELLEQEIACWAALDEVEPVAAPEGPAEHESDPGRLDDELRRLASMRERWDEVFGHLAMLLRSVGLFREAGFSSMAHYCRERLGMGVRTVEQRIWLERRLYSLPELREAMREGRVTYEKARLVASCAREDTVQGWIERAENLTCIALRREIEARETAQMCARRELDLRLPRRVALLLSLALRAAREAADQWLSPHEGLVRMAEHFVDTWEKALAERSTLQKRVLARDRGLCQVPGCSRAAAHVHHVVYRSRGGGDERSNLTSVCAAHHLHGLHLGWVRVRGQAPDALSWELGYGKELAP